MFYQTLRRSSRRLLSTSAKDVPTAQGWARPVAEGFIPAYDHALKIIEANSNQQRQEISRLQSKGNLSSTEKARLAKLEITSEINKPQVRWDFENGKVDMAQPVFRHLAERRWRDMGRLDLVMQRVNTMHVIPDLLADFHPSLDVRLHFPAQQQNNQKPELEEVEPGVMLTPQQTLRAPQLSVTAFHPEERLYTLLMIDPDVPDVTNQSFTTYLHWLQPNIKLSALTTDQWSPDTPGLSYVPPHPQQGSPPHRYVLFLLPNPDPTRPIAIPSISPDQRVGFNLRQFASDYGFKTNKGGGVHLWRQEWSTTVSHIYNTMLHVPEPRYGRAPKPDRYAEVKKSQKYAL